MGSDDQLVARAPEIEELDGAWTLTLDGRVPLVAILGDVGTGKSFLVDNYLRRLERRHPALVAACASAQPLVGRATSLQPIREMLGHLTGLGVAESAAVRSTREEDRLRVARSSALTALLRDAPALCGTLLPAPSYEWLKEANADPDVVKQWIAQGADDQQDERLHNSDTIRTTIGSLIRALNFPLALVLDDLQWADTASLQVFLSLQRELLGRPVILFGTYRTGEPQSPLVGEEFTVAELSAALRRDAANVIIDLNETRRTRGAQFCAELLALHGIDPAPANVSELLSLTGGNALFARDALQLLLAASRAADQSAVPTYSPPPSIAWADLPRKHAGLLEQRLQQLDKTAASLLETAAVEGQEFTAEVLGEIHGMNLLTVLEVLEVSLGRNSRLVEEIDGTSARSSQANAPVPLSRFRFSHGVYQQFIYHDRIGAARRRELHRRVAFTLQSLWQQHANRIAAQLAGHFDLAGEVALAVKYYASAAQAALMFSDFEAAGRCAEAGRRLLLGTGPAIAGDSITTVYDVATTAARVRGDFKRAAELASEGLEIAEASASPSLRAKLKSELARSYYNRDIKYADAAQLLNEALDEGDAEQEADLRRQLGIVHQRQGQYVAALREYRAALHAVRVRGGLITADIVNSAGVAFGLLGLFEVSAACHHAALALTARTGNVARDTLFLNDYAAPLRRLGRVDEAIAVVERAKSLARAQGKIGALARATYEDAQLARLTRNWSAYERCLREVLQLGAELEGQSPQLPKARAELALLRVMSTATNIEFPDSSDVLSFGQPGVSGTSELHSVDLVLALINFAYDRASADDRASSVVHSVATFHNDPCWAWPFLHAFGLALLASLRDDADAARNAHEIYAAACHYAHSTAVEREVAFVRDLVAGISGIALSYTRIPTRSVKRTDQLSELARAFTQEVAHL